MQFNKLQIKDICKIIGGQPAPKGNNSFCSVGLPFVRMKDFGRYHLTNNLFDVDDCLSEDYLKRSKVKIVKKGSILLPRSGSVGLNHRAILGRDAVIVSHICALEVIDRKIVNNSYLYYYLQTIDMVSITKKTTGLDAITFEDLAKIIIPIPPISYQDRIATILDHADSIRRINRQILEKYNELAQSAFHQMFGDPEKNQFRFPVGTIRDLVTEVKYGTSNKSSDKGKYPYLRMNNLTYDGNMDYSDMKYIDILEEEKTKYTVRNGDILFNRTNSKELVGKTAIFKSSEEMVIAGYLIRVRVNQKANPEYISAYLNSQHGKSTLYGMCKSIIGMANINAQEMQNINILMPPINLQNRFALIVELIANQKAITQKSFNKSEELFQCLLQRAFKGEL